MPEIEKEITELAVNKKHSSLSEEKGILPPKMPIPLIDGYLLLALTSRPMMIFEKYYLGEQKPKISPICNRFFLEKNPTKNLAKIR